MSGVQDPEARDIEQCSCQSAIPLLRSDLLVPLCLPIKPVAGGQAALLMQISLRQFLTMAAACGRYHRHTTNAHAQSRGLVYLW